MPIRRFLGRDTFDPAHLAVMGTAFTAALDKLGLKKHNDPVVQVLAHKIIWAARNGERDQKKRSRAHQRPRMPAGRNASVRRRIPNETAGAHEGP